MKNNGKPSIKFRQTTSSRHAVTLAVLRNTIRGTSLTVSVVPQGNAAQSLPVSGFMHLVCRYLIILHETGMDQVQLLSKRKCTQ